MISHRKASCCVLAPLLGLCLMAGCLEQPSGLRVPIPDDLDQPEEQPVQGPPAWPMPECELDEFGLQRKVLVVSDNLRSMDRPGGNADGTVLKYFWPYFVFERQLDDRGVPEFYRIGAEPYRSTIEGWVSAADVVPWTTRVGARLTAKSLLLYKEPESVVELIQNGATTAKPLARATLRADRSFMPWPISEVRRVEINGRIHELVRVQFLGKVRDAAGDSCAWGDPNAYSDAVLDSIEEEVGQIDIVFCVDNSESTKVYAEAIQKAIRTISYQLKSCDVQFSLVLYRDHGSRRVMFPEGAVRIAFPLSGELDNFLAAVNSIEEAPGDPVDWAEAGYDGLFTAITKTPWRGDKLAQHVVVLVSDNSFHEPGEARNPGGIGLTDISTAAAERNVKVFSLGIYGGGGYIEQARHVKQVQDIARATGGSAQSLSVSSWDRHAKSVADAVLKLVKEKVGQVTPRPGIVQELRDGVPEAEISRRRNVGMDQVTDVVRILDNAGYDLRKMSRNGTVPAEGWTFCEFEGSPVLEREILVSEGELDTLLATLKTLCVVCEEADFGEAMVKAGVFLRTNPLADFMDRDFLETLDVYLMARGIPAGTTSLLRRTPEEIRNMSEPERAALRQRLITDFIFELDEIRKNRDVWEVAHSQRFTWIPERLLP